MQFVTESVRPSVSKILWHQFKPLFSTTAHTNHRLYSVYSVYILKLIGPKGTHRLYSVYSLDILKLIGHKGTDRLYSVYSLNLIGNKGTKSIVSDLVNILKMIGLEGTLRFVQCVLCCVQIYKQGRLENL